MFRTFYHFNDTVGCLTANIKTFSNILNRLMMMTIYDNLILFHDIVEKATFRNLYRMCPIICRCFLAMFIQFLFMLSITILIQSCTRCDVSHLHTTAYSENWFILFKHFLK